MVDLFIRMSQVYVLTVFVSQLRVAVSVVGAICVYAVLKLQGIPDLGCAFCSLGVPLSIYSFSAAINTIRMAIDAAMNAREQMADLAGEFFSVFAVLSICHLLLIVGYALLTITSVDHQVSYYVLGAAYCLLSAAHLKK